MSSFYDRMRSTSTDLISRFGKEVTLTRYEQGVFDPVSGSYSTTEITLTGNGVFLNYSSKDIDGMTVLSSDKKMLYTGEKPAINDSYGDYRIVDYAELNPDESGSILYTCQMRK